MKKTIKRTELMRMAFCNSSKLPRKVNIDGRAKQWVGIGWIDIGPVRRWLTTVVD